MIRSPRPAARSLPAAPLWGPRRRPAAGPPSSRAAGHPWPAAELQRATAYSCKHSRAAASVPPMPEQDLFKRYLDAGVAFTQMTRAKAEELVKEWVKAGEVQRDQVQERV